MQFTSINPATGEHLARYDAVEPSEVSRIIDAAHHAFRSWSETSIQARARPMVRMAALLRENIDRYAELMTREMGKPIRQSRGEVEKCAWLCEYYAEHSGRFLQERPVDTGEGATFVTYEPMGIAFAIMPWNFPFWQVLRFAVPAVMAGNAALLKHSPNVPGCSLALGELFRDAGFPEGLFGALLIDVPMVESIIADPRVRTVSLTGSIRAGRAVAALAGRYLKKTVLELGGSDPYVVLADADMGQTVSACAASRVINSGQSCIAAKRFIVVRERLEEFIDGLVATMSRNVVGDPMDEMTTIGPLARESLRTQLDDQVRRSIDAGASAVLGCSLPDGPGYFYPPSVLSGVRPGMAAYDEELFGPVASVIEARSEDDAIRIANDTSFGLGGAVFTRDVPRGRDIASHRIDSGAVFVNAFVKSDPRVPFGGTKDSGYGRELSWLGIREFCNIKTVWIA